MVEYKEVIIFLVMYDNLDQRREEFGNRERIQMYPDRATEGVDTVIKEVSDLISGKEKPLQLSEEDKKILLYRENILAEELEAIHDIKIESETFYLEYFLTSEGTNKLQTLYPLEKIPNTFPELRKFFYRHMYSLKAMDDKNITELAGAAKNYSESKLLNQIRINTDGSVDISEAKMPERVSVGFSPIEKLEKLKRLRTFRKQVHDEITRCQAIPEATLRDDQKAYLEILYMYKARVNEMIADGYSGLYSLVRKQEALGTEGLTKEEIALLKFAIGRKNMDKSLARLDMMMHGAAKNIAKERVPVSDALRARADIAITLRVTNENEKEERMKEKGLDPEKLNAKNITFDQRHAWINTVLSSMGILSEFTEYDAKRVGRAPDGKWQHVSRPGRKTLAVNGKQGVMLDSSNPSSVIDALSVAAHHEIIHILQHENRRTQPLRLFHKLGGDRTGLFAEGGAMYCEAKFKKEAFGYDMVPTPGYVKAMDAAINGGSYLDCVKAFYDAEIVSIKAKYKDLETNINEQAAFQKEAKQILAKAIDRAKRSFRGADLGEGQYTPGFVRDSDYTKYIEQEIVMEMLDKAGLLKLAFLGGMNLRNVRALLKMGMLDLSQIQKPTDAAFQIWETVKKDYTLSEPFEDQGKDI